MFVCFSNLTFASGVTSFVNVLAIVHAIGLPSLSLEYRQQDVWNSWAFTTTTDGSQALDLLVQSDFSSGIQTDMRDR